MSKGQKQGTIAAKPEEIAAFKAAATDENIAEGERRRLCIECDDAEELRILDTICYNEQCRADGQPVGSQIHIAWYQRLFSSLIDIGEPGPQAST